MKLPVQLGTLNPTLGALLQYGMHTHSDRVVSRAQLTPGSHNPVTCACDRRRCSPEEARTADMSYYSTRSATLVLNPVDPSMTVAELFKVVIALLQVDLGREM